MLLDIFHVLIHSLYLNQRMSFYFLEQARLEIRCRHGDHREDKLVEDAPQRQRTCVRPGFSPHTKGREGEKVGERHYFILGGGSPKAQEVPGPSLKFSANCSVSQCSSSSTWYCWDPVVLGITRSPECSRNDSSGNHSRISHMQGLPLNPDVLSLGPEITSRS